MSQSASTATTNAGSGSITYAPGYDGGPGISGNILPLLLAVLLGAGLIWFILKRKK